MIRRMGLDVLAYQEEGSFEVTGFEQVKQPRRVLGAGPIPKRHGQGGPLDPHVGINAVGQSDNVGSRRGRFALVLGLGTIARAQKRKAKKEKVTHRIRLKSPTSTRSPNGPRNYASRRQCVLGDRRSTSND